MQAELLASAWRRVDIKLTLDGAMHLLAWRRRWFHDEVLFDGRRVASAPGVFTREGSFGFEIRRENGETLRLLLTVDPNEDESAWSMSMRPGGVRLETAEEALIATGTLGPPRADAFSDLFSRAAKALGLS